MKTYKKFLMILLWVMVGRDGFCMQTGSFSIHDGKLVTGGCGAQCNEISGKIASTPAASPIKYLHPWEGIITFPTHDPVLTTKAQEDLFTAVMKVFANPADEKMYQVVIDLVIAGGDPATVSVKIPE